MCPVIRSPSLAFVVAAVGLFLPPAAPVTADDARFGPQKTLDGYFPFTPPTDAAAWPARREAVRRRVLVSLGLWPEPTKTPLEPVIHGRIDRGDYTVEKVFFESLPGLFVTGNLYRPKHVTGRAPGVLFAHGHWRNARLAEETPEKLRAEIAGGEERFEQGGRSRFQSLCVQAARMGCVVWQWDMLGESDCLQLSHELVHRFAKQRPDMNAATGWGLYSPRAEARLQSVMGLQAWNSVRSLDFLLSLPEVDPARIAMTGSSGGGTQTMILAAIDDRLALSYPVVMVSTAMQGGCTCENASLLRIGTGNVELAALFAPKPQGMNTANDWTKELATTGFPELQRLYGLLGAKDAVALQRGEHFPHNYNAVTRSGFYTFLNRHFRLGLPAPVIERDYEPLSREELTVWDADHPAPPANDPAFEKRLLSWLAADSDATVGRLTATADGMAEVIRPAFETLVGRSFADTGKVAWEQADDALADGTRRTSGVVRNQTHGEEVAVTLLAPDAWKGDVIIWLGDRGRGSLADEGGRPVPAVARLLAGGAAVVGVDLFRHTEDPPAKNRTVREDREAAAYTYGYNHPLLAQRAHDVLTVLVALQRGGLGDLGRPRRVMLAAFGETAPVAAAARAVAGAAIAKTALDTRGFRFAELADWRDPSFLPGGAKYLDLPGFLAAHPLPLWLAGEPEPTTAEAAAYAAFGGDAWLTRHDGPAETAPLAAADWLLKP
jgi:dienelactone hydrolase